jgi:RNA polymerase sigma-70 factor (ECF subfamily)
LVAAADTELAPQAVLERERARLVRLCTSLTSNPAAAEDLAQETLVEAWRLRARLYDPEGLSAWISAIARNICLRWSRQHGQERSRTEPVDSIEDLVVDGIDLHTELERDELTDLLERALSLLPPETRQALIQCYVEERPHGEVAASLGVSESAVGMRLLRGKLALRRTLAGQLRNEASAYGIDSPGGEWERTRIWCPSCGEARLSLRIDNAEKSFTARCMACRTDTVDHAADYLSQVRGHRRILLRSFREAHRYFRNGLATGSVACGYCGKPVPLRVGLPAASGGSMQGLEGVQVHCRACGTVSFQPESGLVLTLPDVERFWREQKRIRMLPGESLDVAGRPGRLTRFESVTSRETLEIISLRHTFEVVGAYRSAGISSVGVA